MNLQLRFPEEFKEELAQIIREVIAEEMKDMKGDKGDEEKSNKLLNLQEACEFLNCSKTTLYHYRRKGLVEYHQVGRKIFFRKSSLLSRIKIERV